jgi:hypothetical protein
MYRIVFWRCTGVHDPKTRSAYTWTHARGCSCRLYFVCGFGNHGRIGIKGSQCTSEFGRILPSLSRGWCLCEGRKGDGGMEVAVGFTRWDHRRKAKEGQVRSDRFDRTDFFPHAGLWFARSVAACTGGGDVDTRALPQPPPLCMTFPQNALPVAPPTHPSHPAVRRALMVRCRPSNSPSEFPWTVPE